MRKNREMRAVLQAHGCMMRQGKGDHQIWTHPAQPRFRLVLCGKDGSDVQKYQEARLRKLRRAS
ncbi:MAG: type II toxin-antitoxin system HicA family toxin [Ktedonobacteraceae bacterium]|nr:type II toxin-antitoxin system HicA family toxin [Ktedonobacteraceae bacterium]